ncbi:hypothetical protein EDEG_01580 [Edhazardia aedis USNM 41457]|uniref:Uncharacterized protein n=1 Tax=Edhazardia aedis (strain USNM 41457) TaxID=1003232 RepID=J9D9H4_EDHAE|nr:hypothetical protein EDEG_01580 [Edhazardia aedis USNM 41457]|eukprot:EJW04144.1 hypothetical protein EDEG_01580 [Edhazardia aedis USNM 41457]
MAKPYMSIILTIMTVILVLSIQIILSIKKYFTNKTRKVFEERYNKLINFIPIEKKLRFTYIESIINLQKEIREAKRRLDRSKKFEPTLRTYEHNKMLYKLKIRFWEFVKKELIKDSSMVHSQNTMKIYQLDIERTIEKIQSDIREDMYIFIIAHPLVCYLKNYNNINGYMKSCIKSFNNKIGITANESTKLLKFVDVLTETLITIPDDYKNYLNPKYCESIDESTIITINMEVEEKMERILSNYFLTIDKIYEHMNLLHK